MANTINVKVKKTVLIAGIKKAIKARKDEQAKIKKAQEAHNAKAEKWLADQLKKVQSKKPESIQQNHSPYNSRGNTLSVQYKLPDNAKPPQMDISRKFNSYNDDEINALENAMRLLEMSDDEYVKTSSYGSISRYL